MTYEKYEMDITIFEDDCVFTDLILSGDGENGGTVKNSYFGYPSDK